MTRLYYDCPIEALYMVINHGVKIKDYTENELRHDISIDSSGGLYYVEKLSIFKPKYGDKDDDGFIFDKKSLANCGMGWFKDSALGYYCKKKSQTAFRNNKAFFTPKSE